MAEGHSESSRPKKLVLLVLSKNIRFLERTEFKYVPENSNSFKINIKTNKIQVIVKCCYI